MYALYQRLAVADLIYPMIVALIISVVLSMILVRVFEYLAEAKRDRLQAQAGYKTPVKMDTGIAQRRLELRLRLQQARRSQ